MYYFSIKPTLNLYVACIYYTNILDVCMYMYKHLVGNINVFVYICMYKTICFAFDYYFNLQQRPVYNKLRGNKFYDPLNV